VTYALSQRSLEKLQGVDDRLVRVVLRAIQITKVDFGVVQGVRTMAEQAALVAKGASQTMQSKHLDGKAVDLMAYIDGRASWELSLYDDIAEAMKIAGREQSVALRWGAAWSVRDITKWQGSMEGAMNSYIDDRRTAGQRPFIDAPHFELV
jgi:peptidoglycan L-alanyl-D-glutamate endopeptidase CwlK